MSLINDALKKAQKQREGSGTDSIVPLSPSASPGPGGPSVGGSLPTGKNNLALIIAGSAAIVALSVVATVYLLRNDQSSISPPTVARGPANLPILPAPPAVVDAAAAASPLAAPPAPANSVPPGPEINRNGPPNTPTVSSPTPPLQSAPATAQPAPPAVVTAPPLPEIAPPVLAPEVNQIKTTNRIQGMIDKFRISGIRLADAESKVLLNDHLFRVNDLVEPSLGLRLTKIDSHALTFTDADGNSYLKHF